MRKLLDIINNLHKKTQRDYLGRMMDDKVECVKIAKKYDKDFWDGERRHGYGGFKYDGRWEPVARQLIEKYNLKADAKILDVGCGKGFLLYELKKLLPQATVKGFDISQYAIENAKAEIKGDLFVQRAQDRFPYKDKEFDLVISINTLHNLLLFDFVSALKEVERVGRDKYIVVEAYRNERELFNLECWVLTGQCFFKPEEWTWLFDQYGYSGDYEFIYFE
ncbi:MAG: class I SAM-dependent methyltransferase [Candidatus Margulisbacteria bacterium]|nr:class I SAM-dependent methyltransferase [Candidatus Margulisiibacteriota bacterium]